MIAPNSGPLDFLQGPDWRLLGNRWECWQSRTLTIISALESLDSLENGGFIIAGSSSAISSVSVTSSSPLEGSSRSDSSNFLAAALSACPVPYLRLDLSCIMTSSCSSAG